MLVLGVSVVLLFGGKTRWTELERGCTGIQPESRASSDTNISRLEHFEHDDRRVEQVPHFMRQEPCPLVRSRGLSIQGGLILLAAELGDGTRDGVVKAPNFAQNRSDWS
jgi:hypothetical protein